MSYAVLIHVKLLEGRSEGEGERLLHEVVIPTSKAQPGFQKGSWMQSADKTTGIALVVFDTSENAYAATANLKPPPGGPQLVSCDVSEVLAEA